MLAVIGDFVPDAPLHAATNKAVTDFISRNDARLDYEWVATESIETRLEELAERSTAFWIAPGSPYKSMHGVLKIIRYARENGIPCLGTCGGFQHMVIEFARNVLRLEDAAHAEYDPYASRLVINPLRCSLVGQTLEIELPDPGSLTARIYQAARIQEKYYCNFGLNPEYESLLQENGFRIAGSDHLHEARILELERHPFFIATLFVPQDNLSPGGHPLINAFLQSALQP